MRFITLRHLQINQKNFLARMSSNFATSSTSTTTSNSSVSTTTMTTTTTPSTKEPLHIDDDQKRIESENCVKSLTNVQEKLRQALNGANRSKPPRLVAVSKTKPTFLIQALYDAGHRHFGENYVQELFDKSNELEHKCPEIKWHFIGHLQSNKVKEIRGVKNLYAIETVDSKKLAQKLNDAFANAEIKPLAFIQINTSGEEAKSGVDANQDAIDLALYVRSLSNLQFAGLMTIGAPDNGTEDFKKLNDCRNKVAAALGVDAASLELSMGMSADYELATAFGSTNVRVGSTIFGHRNYEK